MSPSRQLQTHPQIRALYEHVRSVVLEGVADAVWSALHEHQQCVYDDHDDGEYRPLQRVLDVGRGARARGRGVDDDVACYEDRYYWYEPATRLWLRHNICLLLLLCRLFLYMTCFPCMRCCMHTQG